MACRRGHAPGLILPTNRGVGGGGSGSSGGGCGAICLGCLAEMLVDPSSFVTHKAYALADLSRNLEDEAFADGFLRYHSHFLVGPLCQSVFFCQDEALAQATVDFILSLCRSTLEDDRSLLDDFITFVSMQLGGRSTIVWSKGQGYALHAMGLLLDLHGKMDPDIPRTLQFQALLENMVLALQHAGDDIKGEVLFLLYKISSFKGGMEKLSNWLKKIITLTVGALLKAETDELRANAIALLSVLARNAVFQLRDQDSESQGTEIRSDALAIPDDFVATFAEAIKGSLLSSDVQVQLSALQLIVSICPNDVNISRELNILVNEGIADYIFEVLRVSESLSTLAVTAIRVLSILSAAGNAFSQRLMLGIESIIRVLEHSTGAGFFSVQEDALQLLGDGICRCPGTVNTSKAEQIFEILARILQQHSDRVQSTDSGMTENVSSGTYGVACVAMLALQMTPGYSSVDSIRQRLLAVLSNVMTTVLFEHSIETKTLACSLTLLQQAFHCEAGSGTEFFSVFEQQFVPYLAQRATIFEDEMAVEFIFAFLTLVIQTKVTENNDALGFSGKLARAKWISLGFAGTGRFRSESFKHRILTFVATLIDALDEDREPDQGSIQDLPTDPSELLALLDHSGGFDPRVHSAAISVIYTSYTHQDRLVDSKQLLASLEQFVLLHSSSFKTNTKCLLQVIGIYALIKQESSAESHFSIEAENLLVTSIQHNESSNSIGFKVPASVRNWMLSQKELKPLCSRHIYDLIRSASSSETNSAADLEALCSVLEHETGVGFVNSLLHRVALENAGNDMEMLTTVLKRILVVKKHLSLQFLQKDIASNLRNWYILCGAKASASTLIAFVELLFEFLRTLTPDAANRKNGSWQDIANQTMYVFIRDDCSDQDLAIAILSFLCLLCYQFSIGLSFLSDAATEILKNKELGSALRERIDGSLGKSSFSIRNIKDEQILCLALLFQLLLLQQSKNGEIDKAIAVTFESICKIIYSMPGLPRVLAFCCLSEKLRHSTGSTVRLDSAFQPSSLSSMLQLLQGFVLDGNELVQVNASSSLLFLLTSKLLTKKQRETVESSPWYCFLASEITRAISICADKSVAETKIELLVNLLKISKNQNWFSSAFNASNIASVVSTLSSRQVSFWEVCFFLELLRMKSLDRRHIKELSEHYQSYRKTCIKFCNKRNNLAISTHQQQRHSGNAAQSSFLIVIDMVLSQCGGDAPETKAVLGKIDEFIREGAKP